MLQSSLTVSKWSYLRQLHPTCSWLTNLRHGEGLPSRWSFLRIDGRAKLRSWHWSRAFYLERSYHRLEVFQIIQINFFLALLLQKELLFDPFAWWIQPPWILRKHLPEAIFLFQLTLALASPIDLHALCFLACLTSFMNIGLIHASFCTSVRWISTSGLLPAVRAFSPRRLPYRFLVACITESF
jgi:hypothetical protein